MTSFNARCSGPIESIDHELDERVENINVEVTTQLDTNNKAKEGEDMGFGNAFGIDPNIPLYPGSTIGLTAAQMLLLSFAVDCSLTRVCWTYSVCFYQVNRIFPKRFTCWRKNLIIANPNLSTSVNFLRKTRWFANATT